MTVSDGLNTNLPLERLGHIRTKAHVRKSIWAVGDSKKWCGEQVLSPTVQEARLQRECSFWSVSRLPICGVRNLPLDIAVTIDGKILDHGTLLNGPIVLECA